MRSSTIALLALLTLGCTSALSDPHGTANPSDAPKPGVSLLDVNATSATYDTEVASDGLRGRVGAWYYGHAT